MVKGILRILIGLAMLAHPITTYIGFNQECAGYLKQAADANTAQLSLERLNLALKYIESNNLTHGYTSVFYKTESENIGYWYRNLKACQKELTACLGASQLEQSNVLMKVRESLTDEGSEGVELTYPRGLAFYPNNLMYGIISLLGVLLIILGGYKLTEDY